MPPSASDPATDEATPIEVTSLFVRGRNALAVRADFSPLYVDYYLHWMDCGIRQEEPYDSLLKKAIAALVLHATTRPWRETHAWTLNVPSPRCNIFATASSLQETVVGRVFTDDVRAIPRGLFHAQTIARNEEPRNSAIPLEHEEVFPAVESFYRLSEQRRARIFELSDEAYIMISAQPECDETWLENLTPEAVRTLDRDEELGFLETRRFRFACGCSLDRILPVLTPLAAGDTDELFQGDPAITISCPRCGNKWRITREQFEAARDSS